MKSKPQAWLLVWAALLGACSSSPPEPGFSREQVVHRVASSCLDAAQDSFVFYSLLQGSEPSWYQEITPLCFPAYRFQHEGLLTLEGRPLPRMGRTCGRFRVLVVFMDTPTNRSLFGQNTAVPQVFRDQMASGQAKLALEGLLASYTPGMLLGWIGTPLPPVELQFSVEVSSAASDSFATLVSGQSTFVGNGYQDTRVYQLAGPGQQFPAYDAVLWLDDLPQAGWGIQRWPKQHPTQYGQQGSFVFRIDPQWLSPGLLANELLRRNLPTLLGEYTFGPRQSQIIGGVTYAWYPTYNPRTGEDIEPLINQQKGGVPLWLYYAGYRDLDNDSLTDCVDPILRATAQNQDADLVPDRLDPDLGVDHSAYLWTYQPPAVP